MAKSVKRQPPAEMLDGEIQNGRQRIFPRRVLRRKYCPKFFLRLLLMPCSNEVGHVNEVSKAPINIRLSPDVVEAFRATGRGWQTRVDEALKDWLKSHKAASNH